MELCVHARRRAWVKGWGKGDGGWGKGGTGRTITNVPAHAPETNAAVSTTIECPLVTTSHLQPSTCRRCRAAAARARNRERGAVAEVVRVVRGRTRVQSACSNR
jgi:hypothetical protein